MPRGYGRDSVAVERDGTIVITSPIPKGWTATVEKTLTSARHPGTAVLWEDHCYEVIGAEATADGRTIYRLAPWRDEHVMRQTDSYDRKTESERLRRWQQLKDNENKRVLYTLLAPITGMAPRSVQEEWHLEIGTPPTRLSYLSAALCLLYGGYSIVWLFAGEGKPRPPLPALGAYLFLEALIRLRALLLLNNPAGSVLGYIAYGFWYLLGGRKHVQKRTLEKVESRRKLAPADRYERAHLAHRILGDAKKAARDFGALRAKALEIPDEVRLADSYRMREPYLALLSERDQLLLEWRLGFEPLLWGRRTAWFLLLFSSLGSLTSFWRLLADPTLATIAALALALIVSIEQIARLVRISKGKPAPSMFAPFVRPFVQKVFDIDPTVMANPEMTSDQAVELSKERARMNLPDVWDGEEDGDEER